MHKIELEEKLSISCDFEISGNPTRCKIMLNLKVKIFLPLDITTDMIHWVFFNSASLYDLCRRDQYNVQFPTSCKTTGEDNNTQKNDPDKNCEQNSRRIQPATPCKDQM